MASLIVLLGSLSYIMVLAVINGSVGFIAAMGVTVAGATGVAKALGILGLCAEIPLAWGWIIGIAVGCGARQRGALVYAKHTPRCQMVLFSIKCRTLHLSKIML